MKRGIASFFFILFFNSGNAQCLTCNANSQLETACSDEFYRDGQPTFDDNCVLGWRPSHGTPQIINKDPRNIYPEFLTRPVYNTAYMWSYDQTGAINSEHSPKGEGVLASYCFKKGLTYKFRVRYMFTRKDPPPMGDYATMNLQAVQNVHRPTKWKYGNHTPSADRTQTIATVSLFGSGNPYAFQEVSYTVTMNNDYEEFWIFPIALRSLNQVNLWVDLATICVEECESLVNYNQGNIPASNPRTGIINVGSTFGGSGTVSTFPTANTVVQAGKEINVAQLFESSITSGTLTLEINPCPPNSSTLPDSSWDINSSPFPVENVTTPWTLEEYANEYSTLPIQAQGMPSVSDKIDSLTDKRLPVNNKNTIKIYPNPASGLLTVLLNVNTKGSLDFQIMTMEGATVSKVHRFAASSGNLTFELDVSSLASGSYFLQVTNREKQRVITIVQIQK